jgi:hypothetical protein
VEPKDEGNLLDLDNMEWPTEEKTEEKPAEQVEAPVVHKKGD